MREPVNPAVSIADAQDAEHCFAVSVTMDPAPADRGKDRELIFSRIIDHRLTSTVFLS
jgi:hypothetical protein